MRFLAQTKGRRKKERKRKRKGKEEEGKEEEGKEKGKGGREREIGSEALAETEKNRKRPSRESNPGPQQTRLIALPLSHRDKRYHQPVCLKFYPLCLHFTTMS